MIDPAQDLDVALHLHEPHLRLYSNGQLEPERILAVESHLGGCTYCKQVLSEYLRSRLALRTMEGPDSKAAAKRSEPRFSTEGEATLQQLHPLSLDRQKIEIVNVSKNGLGISSPNAVVPGTIVQLRLKGTVEVGSVRYCSALDGKGFRIGLRLHHGF